MSKINISTLESFQKLLFLNKSQKISEIQRLKKSKANLQRILERLNFFLFNNSSANLIKNNKLFFQPNLHKDSDSRLVLVFLEKNSSNFRVQDRLLSEQKPNDTIILFGQNKKIIDKFFVPFKTHLDIDTSKFIYYISDDFNSQNISVFLDLNINVINYYLGENTNITETWLLTGSSKTKVHFLQITPLYNSFQKLNYKDVKFEEMGGNLTIYSPTKSIWIDNSIASTILIKVRTQLIDSLISDKFFEIYEINQNMDIVNERIEKLIHDEIVERNKQSIDELTILQG